MPKDLRIYFIDVGQGDSTLIITPQNKKILIDGGGSEFGNYNVGENTLLPYLLDRGIKKIDYIIVSHFDTDHVKGLFWIMQKIKVNKVVISKPIESSDNYDEFVDSVMKKKIEVKVVYAGDRINIENDLYLDILWPDKNNLINDNSMNNNAIVCKLNYGNFSMLFTGDIEAIAESKILDCYKNNLKRLKANVLKVAHHGSKSSTIQEFLTAVNPKIALIGVGENNLYGHPANEVIERLDKLRCECL